MQRSAGTAPPRPSRSSCSAPALAAAAVFLALAPASLGAQERDRGRGVPPGHLPPAGMCRVWHDDRPPGQQPRPTSCAAARRDAILDGGRVIHGEERKAGEEATYPTTLPQMAWAVSFARGQRVAEARRWLGPGTLMPQFTDANGDGRPEDVIWHDAGGRIHQRWTDTDGDGRADSVAIYRDERVTRVVRP